VWTLFLEHSSKQKPRTISRSTSRGSYAFSRDSFPE
jgi:hypothetical protein